MTTTTVPAAIRERFTNDWPYAVEGWRIVGDGQNVPGFASEQSAKIAMRKHPEWSGAQVVPFKYWDGSFRGTTRYSEVSTRYAVLIPYVREN